MKLIYPAALLFFYLISYAEADLEQQLAEHIVDIVEKKQSKKLDLNEFKKFNDLFKKNTFFAHYKESLVDHAIIFSETKPKKILELCQNHLLKPKHHLQKLCTEKTLSSKNLSKNDLKQFIDLSPNQDLSKSQRFLLKKKLNRYKSDKSLQKSARHIFASDKNKTSKAHNKYSEVLNLIETTRSLVKEKKNFFISTRKLESKLKRSSEFLNTPSYSKKLLSMIKSVDRYGQPQLSRSLSRLAIEKGSQNIEKYQFQILWTYLSRDQNKDAYKNVLEKYLLHKNVQNIESERLLFWVAKTLDLNNKKDQAQKIYKHIVKKSPLNFYAVLSLNRLTNEDPKKMLAHYKETLTENSKLISFKESKNKQHLSFIKALAKAGSYKLIANNINTFLDKNLLNKLISPQSLYETLGDELQKSGDYLSSFKIIYNGLNKNLIGLSPKVLEILYPKPYFKKISTSFKQNPYLALSLMRQESSFNPKARSIAGARGLMQIMPKTAKGLDRKSTTKKLANPDYNIKLGTKYLKDLFKRQEQNFVYTLSSYNAGEHNVKTWRKKYFFSDSLFRNIENIPFNETRKYVKLIFRNIFFYNIIDRLNERKPASLAFNIFKDYLEIKH